MNISTLKKPLAEAFVNKLGQLRHKFSGESIVQLDIGVFPWQGNIELSLRLENDCIDARNIADWPNYNVSQFFEDQWPEIRESCEQMQEMWERDAASSEDFFKLVAEVVQSPKVAAEITKMPCSDSFQLTLFNPDDHESLNYCS